MAIRAHAHSAALPRRAAGVTLVELAVVLSIIGLLSVAMSAGYADYAQQSAASVAKADAEAARQAVRAFVLRNKRLPCPDLSAQGDVAREGLGGSCPAGAQVGWLPYESLGLTRPDRSARLRYAVSRSPAADLVAPTVAGSSDLDGTARLRAALAAAARLPDGSDRPFLTGAGTTGSPEDCAVVQSNPAFALVAPVTDRDDAGPAPFGFDGVNVAMASANRNCIAAPSRRADARYDDVVVAESASALLGWLAARTR
jgi:prepilin-type N-terminal cleavage/methylation domain-containing protein